MYSRHVYLEGITMKNTIQAKLVRNYIVIIVFMSLLIIGVHSYANRQITQAQAEVERYEEVRNLILKIIGEFKVEELTLHFLLDGEDQKQRERLAQSQEALRHYYQQIKKLLESDTILQANLRESIDPVLTGLTDLANQVQHHQSQTPEFQRQVNELLLTGVWDHVNFMDQLEQKYAQAVSLVDTVNRQTQRTRLMLVVILAALAVAVSYLITRKVTSSLQIFIKELRKVSAGKYQTLDGIWADNEIGELVRAYNQMVTTIRSNEAALQDKNEELTAQGEELSAQNEEILAQQEALQQAVADLTQHQELLARLYRFSQTLTQTMELDQLVESAFNRILYETESQVGAFMLYNIPTAELEVRKMAGLAATQNFGMDDSLAGQAAREKQPLVVGYNEGQLYTRGLRGKMAMTSEIYLPLTFHGDLLGVIALGRTGHAFSVEEQKMLASLAAQIAVAVHNALTHLQVRQALEQVKEIDRLKSELINTVSHELRTPLASIFGFAELLLKKSPEAGKAQKYMTMIYQEARRLTGLINDFLDLQRIENRSFELVKKPVDLAELIRVNVEVYQGQSTAHTLTVSVEPNLPPVNTDPDRVSQVLGNLLSNAVKYSPTGGLIEVAAVRRSSQEVEVTVKDNGLGIPAEALPKLFHPFYRVDNSDRRQIGGTGLGLALCQQMLRALGGEIWVRSEYEKGSTFSFSLPIA
jgi:signal transduction histidine kinase/HAMP domain-containing protein